MPDEVKPEKVEAKEGEPKIGDQSSQVAELLAGFEPPAPKKEPEKEPEKKEPEKAEPEKKEPEKKEPEKKEPEKKIEGDERDETIKTLQAQIKELVARLAAKPEPKKEPEKKEPEKKEPEKEPEKPGIGFFKDTAEYDKAFEDPKVMNDVLSRVHAKAEENILRKLPQVLDTVVRTQMDMYMRTYKFYDENQDLREHKEFVGFVANDISGKNPDWTLDKLFEELSGEVRKRIGLKKEAEGKEKKSSDKPGFAPGKTGSRKPSEKKEELTPMEQQITDLMV